MISERAVLKALPLETSDHQILAEIIGFVADRLMALDGVQLCGDGAHDDLTRGRNAETDIVRRWVTRAVTVDVQITKLRMGSYFPKLLELRRAS